MPEAKLLETFKNPKPERFYTIEIVAPEFTALCPITGQPDFGKITVRYVPDQLCIELKSFKLYIFSFRNEGSFYETTVNKILDDLVALLKPRNMMVIGDFTPRGGISTSVTAAYFSESSKQ